MSTQNTTIDSALDFVSTGGKTDRPRGVVQAIRDFFASLRSGIDAAHHYERLKAQGVPPHEAVQIVFRDHFENKN